MHPNILEDRRKSKIGGFSGFSAVTGAAGGVGLSEGLRRIREDEELGGERTKPEVGPRESVRSNGTEDLGGCDLNYDGAVASFDH